MRASLLLAIGVLLSGCAATPAIQVAKPDISINLPIPLMQPPEPLTPFLWADPAAVPNARGPPT